MLYMPYVENYTDILNETDVDYDIINWDRFGIEEESSFIYKDNKIGHQRGILDYYKFKRFVSKHLNTRKYDKVIVFGIPMMFFLKRAILSRFKGNYVLDIRDYHKMLKYFNIFRIVNKSSFVVLSSPGFKKWLPNSDKYIINHNTRIRGLDELNNFEMLCNKKKISIAYIGSIRDFQINIDFIDALKNNDRIDLYFHGEGHINKDIQKYLDCNNIKNVYLTGRYIKEQEKELYFKNNIINVLRYNDGINNKTALPNRLYNAVVYGKPVIAFGGTYLTEIIKGYGLGLVINNFIGIEDEIVRYIREFDRTTYNKGRKTFLQNVITDNNYFKLNLEKFIGAKTE